MFDLFRSRDKAVRILLAVILGLVAFSMIAYLIPSTGGNGPAQVGDDNVIAKVGTDRITTQAASAAVSAQMKGRQLPPEVMSFMAPQVIQQLINERALALEAQKMGFRVTDEEVATAVRGFLPPDFYDKDGKVNQPLLDRALEQNNTTLPQVLEDTRRQMLVSRLRQVVMNSVVVTKADVEREYRKKGEKVKVAYVLVKPAMFDQQVQVTPAETEAYFNKNRASYQSPEKRSVAVVLLDIAKVEQGINPSDADLQTIYSQSTDRYRTPERVKVRHILLKTDAAKNDDAKVQAKAADLLKQLKAGADFGELAKKNSEDPGSGAKGGELDYVSRGQTVKPFEDAAFSLKPGELSGLVKTVYGYHILQVEQKDEARVKPFAEVREVLAGEYKKKRASQQLQQLADRARAALKTDPAHPENAAASVNGQLIRKDDLKAGEPVPEVGASPEFQNALTTMKKGEVSQPIALQNSRMVVAELTNLVPAHPAALDEVRPQVEAALRNQKLTEMVQKRVDELVSKTKANGNDLDKTAKELGLEVKTPAEFDRQGAVEGFGSANLVIAAFTSKDGSIIGPLNAADGKGVVKVLSHTAPDMTNFASQQTALRDEIKNKLGRERLGVFEDGVRKALEKDGQVKVQNDVLNQFVQRMRG